MNADFIWIEDAVKEYSRSRVWLRAQVDEGKLSVGKAPGDPKVYLLRSELDKLIQIGIVKPANDQTA